MAAAACTFFLWAIPEGFGGPCKGGATDIGTGVIYVILFLAMSIIAWIVLGLAAGLLANLLIPGRRSQGLPGFFNLSTWLTAIAGAAILLLVFHLVTGQSSRSRWSGRSRRPGWFAHR